MVPGARGREEEGKKGVAGGLGKLVSIGFTGAKTELEGEEKLGKGRGAKLIRWGQGGPDRSLPEIARWCGGQADSHKGGKKTFRNLGRGKSVGAVVEFAEGKNLERGSDLAWVRVVARQAAGLTGPMWLPARMRRSKPVGWGGGLNGRECTLGPGSRCFSNQGTGWKHRGQAETLVVGTKWGPENCLGKQNRRMRGFLLFSTSIS